MTKNFVLIILSFVISFIALVSVTITIKQRLKDLVVYNEAIEHTYLVISQLHEVESNIKDVETGTRGYLLSGDSAFLQPYLSSIKKVDASLDSLALLIKDNISQLNRYKLLKVDITEKMGIMAYYTTLKSKNLVTGVTDGMRKSNYLMGEIRNRIIDMKNVETILLLQRKKQKESYEGNTPTYLSVSLGLSLIITIVSFFFILREFRTRASYQKQLEIKIEELNYSNNELQQLTEISSHDLQEPLRKLRLFSSKLLHNSKSSVDDTIKKSVERIEASSQQMQLLIDDVVIYSNLSKNDLLKEKINLNTLILEAGKTYVENNALQIFIEELPAINGDKNQLELLFRHLLDNAVKYAKPGISAFVKIKYNLVKGDILDTNKQGENFHQITVSDNGIGFNEVYAHKLFAIFRRLHGSASDYKGKGIGLAICKKILFNHNGYITADGKENEGATFTIYFPVEAA